MRARKQIIIQNSNTVSNMDVLYTRQLAKNKKKSTAQHVRPKPISSGGMVT